MTVLDAYRKAWRARGVVVPLFLAVRLLSLAIVVPITASVVQAALTLSGQAALTDQDIAYFFLSPVGFVAFLGLAAIVLVGSIVGLAAMTVNLHQGQAGTLSSLGATIRLLGRRITALVGYAVRLVLRILVFVGPVALVSLVIADRFFGAYDINYYLSTWPPEFVQGVALIGALTVIMLVVLIRRLMAWAVSLHVVLFDEARPGDAFGQSAERMAGKRVELLTRIAVWFALRVVMLFVAAVVFGGAMTLAAGQFGTALRLMLSVVLIIAALWTCVNVLISAVALGALAEILDDRYGGTTRLSDPSGAGRGFTPSARLIGAGLIGLVAVSLFVGGVVLNQVQSDTQVEIIAHRGAAGARPENTLASVRKAVEDGADWVEIDVQETADGQVVVMHDSDFMKQAGVDLKIWEATMEDLAEIDIGSWYDQSYGDERTATLREVLELTRDRSNVLIELKYYGHDVDLEARTIAIVEEAGLADQVATMSLKYPAVQKMKTLRPDWSAGVLAATAIGELTRLDADFIAVSTASVGPRLVRAAEAADKKLYVWTVNDPIEMSAMMSIGVDGLITDEPALAREVMALRAELSTPERVFLMFAEEFGLEVPTGRLSTAEQ